MASVYNTPGVYVEEIPKLPPSVAQVATAIPAFIGYTDIAEKNGVDLVGKAVAIESFKEYETYFGGAPNATYTATLDANDRVSAVALDVKYYMRDSVEMFFANASGRCYILSVGKYGTGVDAQALTDALEILEAYDEPTLIVCPDAALASDNGLYDFQVAALAQCAKLGDRFLICDLKPSDERVAEATFMDRVQEFRNNIQISNLKYGAAYGPYLQATPSRTVRYRDIVLTRGGSASVPLKSLIADPNDPSNLQLLQLIQDLEDAKKAVDKLATGLSAPEVLGGDSKTVADAYKVRFDAYNAASTDATKATAAKGLFSFTLSLLAKAQEWRLLFPEKATSQPNPIAANKSVKFLLRDDMASLANSTGLRATFLKLAQHSNAFGGANADARLWPENAAAGSDLSAAFALLGDMTEDEYDATDAAVSALYSPAGADKNNEARKAMAAAAPVVLKYFNTAVAAAAAYEKTFDDSLDAAFGLYKQIKASIALQAAVLPPSGAVAGVYARVDSERGVWKAPANAGFSRVVGPVVQLTDAQQGALNVDAVAGKSINALRYFSGRGTLVWGARTLAGNDNEWRYVNVRRFFNMVEESCKKATELFVFEPNDANTWVRVRGMLENFLTVQWRQGALQGAKPEHAFYVAVGLGKTMTPLDILEGRMIVEIGLAVVRPAEFIILRFSHMLAES